ncbi:MAG: AI-2E family transporter [Calothrix sp. C42_A2020_038]|nr:AI-2E family transporter [Calothrix sp. C42_A2020_038]
MMQVNKFPRWLTIGIAFPLTILNGWVLLQVIKYFQPLVNIFITAILLAFILDYPIEFFQRQGIRRKLAIAGALLLTVVLGVGLALTLVPLILEQIYELANVLPTWIDSGVEQLQAFQDWALQQQHLPINVSNIVSQALDRLSSQLQTFTGRILSIAVDTIGTIFNVVLTVVLTIYMVLNGDQLWDGVFQWFPRHISTQVRQLLREDFQNYFLGQAVLGAILSVSLILAFVLLQVPLALLFGVTIGIFSLFPFGTTIGIIIVSLLVGLQNFWLGVEIFAVSVGLDQINSNIVAPRLLGNLTGLNPVWVVISLLIGAKLGGVIGVLVAIPIASFIKDIADSWRTGTFKSQASEIVDKKLENTINLEENPDVSIGR